VFSDAIVAEARTDRKVTVSAEVIGAVVAPGVGDQLTRQHSFAAPVAPVLDRRAVGEQTERRPPSVEGTARGDGHRCSCSPISSSSEIGSEQFGHSPPMPMRRMNVEQVSHRCWPTALSPQLSHS